MLSDVSSSSFQETWSLSGYRRRVAELSELLWRDGEFRRKELLEVEGEPAIQRRLEERIGVALERKGPI